MPTREEALAALTGPGGAFEVVGVDVRGAHVPVYASAQPTLRAVFEHSRAFGDRPFLVYNDQRTSFAEFHGLVIGLAHHLANLYGIAKGDRVAIAMRNSPEWVAAFWATQVLGAVAVPLNAWWTGPELTYGLSDSGTTLLFADGERFDRLVPHLPELDGLRAIVSRPEGALPDGAEAYTDALASLDGRAELPPADIAPDDDSTIMYTSGTTGKPKGAIGTHRNHCSCIRNSQLGPAVIAVMAGAPVDAPLPEPADAPQSTVALQTFPYFHIGGLAGLYRHVAIGAKVVLMYRWDAAEAVALIDREGVTGMTGVPTVVRQMLEAAAEVGSSLSTLAAIASGGAPVPPDLVKRIGSQFESRVMPGNGYGLTETTATIVSNAGPMYLERPDSVGRPVPISRARIVAPDESDCPTGVVGELWVQGPLVVRGYRNKPEATAEAFGGGWFRTGDLAYIDEAGFIYVVDRLKDVVIRGGENVYCAEVEATLYEHPAVADVAIVGLPHDVLGEEVAAVIQRRDGMQPTVEELQQHVGAKLARFKVPTRVIIQDEPLPRNATGKVLKRQLREELGAKPA